MIDLSIAEIEERIAQLEEELRALKRNRRAILAGKASAHSRRQEKRNAAIRSSWEGSDHKYGLLQKLSTQYNLTTRQIQRILKNTT